MRGGFLLGAIVGAAATTYIISRRNSSMNMARIGTMVSKAIGDGFQTMTSTSGTQSSQQNTSHSSSATSGKQGKQSQQKHQASSSDDAAAKKQLEQMIAKDASVQKEVNKIMSENTH